MNNMKDAPTDGTPILLHTTCHGWCEAWFSPSEPAAWGDWYADEAIGAAWICCDDAFQIDVEDYHDHEWHHGTADGWLPLPAGSSA